MFGTKYTYCEKSETWGLVYIDGKGMFCSFSCIFDTKQHNGFKTWNNTDIIRCRQDAAEGHFKSKMHKVAYESSQRRDNYYFDREEENEVTMLKMKSILKFILKVYFKSHLLANKRGNCVYQNY